MDLPTYTNIWRIEKRLYKLYDFRLPMPLPVGQIAVFAVIAVPYVLVLSLAGLPFSHTLLWLYVLPPAVLAWLATRPVIENKRLPELLVSQVRYLAEPRTWCRLATLAEPDEITVTCRVWRRDPPELVLAARPARAAAARVPAALPAGRPARLAIPAPVTPAGQAAAARLIEPVPAAEAVPAAAEPVPGWAQRARISAGASMFSRRRPGPARAAPDQARPAWPPPVTTEPAIAEKAVPQPAVPQPAVPEMAAPEMAAPQPVLPETAVPEPGPEPAIARAAKAGHAVASEPARPQALPVPAPPAPRPAAAPQGGPSVTAAGPGSTRPLRVVERALSGPAGQRAEGWHEQVVVVPGGHRPGRPDQQQRDRARARQELRGSHRVVVLGCTVGAGQTITTLMTGEVFARLRDDPVAVLDLNPGSGSLAERAAVTPALEPPPARASRLPGRAPAGVPPSPLEVLSASAAGTGDGVDEELGTMFELISDRYCVTLADPSAAAVPRVLGLAEQLVLVAPASGAAGSALAMTMEWLEAHGYAALASDAVTVLNGVSQATIKQVEYAETVARGRCRAIVRVPWDDGLSNRADIGRRAPASQGVLASQSGLARPRGPAAPRPGTLLRPGTVAAYTALAGLLAVGLAQAPRRQKARA
ncbi:MAG: TcpE family conjugal transfer membrane protein [Streptosporangiaceae bacterium]